MKSKKKQQIKIMVSVTKFILSNQFSLFVEILLQKNRQISASLSINTHKTHGNTHQKILIYLYNFIIFTASNKSI
ncbi:hypothetical protein EG359_01220 [Chryseobacterium joostei]|uniref:Uncharacterized protein n=1 Tax=Chryseobacterium joostei TaxID=112234 RepID=A0ABN5SBH2_9FLAO|nr:hypothetical protein EG359_01220 [Chryseobacterium joostei]HCM35713.1 hypothetical protein [Chryseobacterium sp.]